MPKETRLTVDTGPRNGVTSSRREKGDCVAVADGVPDLEPDMVRERVLEFV